MATATATATAASRFSSPEGWRRAHASRNHAAASFMAPLCAVRASGLLGGVAGYDRPMASHHFAEPTRLRRNSYAVVCLKEKKRVGLPVPRILVEPGRSLVGKAGVTAYTVGSMKDIPGIRTYVSVDGGMSDNMRPMLYGAKYEAMLGNKAEALTDTTVTVAGKHCESGDILIKDAVIAAPEVGDILVTPATGGYCYSMASNYNGSLRPCVLLVRDGEALGSWLSASLMTI